MNEAENITMLNELWEKTDSNTITDNVIELLKNDGYKTPPEQWKILMEITGSKKDAIYAWLNHGRKDVKIPFLKLCMIAEKYNVKLIDLIGGKNMLEKKFAIIKTVGNDEKVLKSFNEDEKEKALAYGEKIAKANDTGVISCALGYFDENGRMVKNMRRVYEVWSSKNKHKID